MAEYGQGNAYWNERYSEEDAVFEWYQSYDGFAAICSKLIKPTSHVLVLGCGNSQMSYDMQKHIGCTVTSIDASPVVIKQMELRHGDNPKLKYLTADCTQLPTPFGPFDIVIDKATLDSILCSDQGEALARHTLREAFRVLQPSGRLIVISCAAPDARSELFRTPTAAVAAAAGLLPAAPAASTASMTPAPGGAFSIPTPVQTHNPAAGWYSWRSEPTMTVPKPRVDGLPSSGGAEADEHYIYILSKN